MALERIALRINPDTIEKVIVDMPELIDVQREFYLTMLSTRKEKLLDLNDPIQFGTSF